MITQEQAVLEIPGAPGYAIATDRTVYSRKRRGRPSGRFPRNPGWAPIKTHSGRRERNPEFVMLWDGQRTIRRTVDDLYETTFSEVAGDL